MKARPELIGSLPVADRRDTHSVALSGGGTVILTVSVDLFSLGKDDREFVFELIDQPQKYESEHLSEDFEQNEQV